MDDAVIRQHLSAARVLIMDIVQASPGADADQITTEWRKRRRPASLGHAERLPRTVSRLLWQLENLGWVERDGRQFLLTALGERARALAPATGVRVR